MRSASALQGAEGAPPRAPHGALRKHRRAEEDGKQDERSDGEDGAEVDPPRIGPGADRRSARDSASSITSVDGILDWYVLGVVFGLGVAAGAASVGALRVPAWAALVVLAGVGALVLVLAVLPWWTIAAFAVALAVAFVFLRRLSVEALPAAILAAVVAAAIPLLGYVAVVATPLVGARLTRRADSRHAGLRILAKD